MLSRRRERVIVVATVLSSRPPRLFGLELLARSWIRDVGDVTRRPPSPAMFTLAFEPILALVRSGTVPAPRDPILRRLGAQVASPRCMRRSSAAKRAAAPRLGREQRHERCRSRTTSGIGHQRRVLEREPRASALPSRSTWIVGESQISSSVATVPTTMLADRARGGAARPEDRQHQRGEVARSPRSRRRATP